MRPQVNVSEEVVTVLDVCAAKMGTNRSAFCAMLIYQGLKDFDKSVAGILDDLPVVESARK